MASGVMAIIHSIEAERDSFVMTCNAAIKELRKLAAKELSKVDNAKFAGHRFSPKVAGTETADNATSRPRGRPRKKKNFRQTATVREAAEKSTRPRRAFSIRKLIREAVLSQTKPFTVRDIKTYVETRHPEVTSKIDSDRYSKELYNLRTVEKLFELASAGEKGAPHVFQNIAA